MELLSLAAVACLGLAAGCGGAESPPQRPTAPAETRRIERIVVATGTIEPEKEVEVRPRIAGIVEKVAVEPGDTVVPGQILVEIERELLEAGTREARAALRAAEVDRRFAKIDLRRAENLKSRGATSASANDDAKALYERSIAQVARARAALDHLEVQLRYATVRSSLTGRVLDVDIEEGSAVSPVTAVTGGSLLLSIAATDRLHLEGLVDENEVARVSVGQPARIRTEAYTDRTFEGRVRKISPVGHRVQNVTYFEVEVEVVDADAQLLRPRMSGDAEIVAEVIEDALVVPEAALRYAGEEIYVDAVADDETGAVERRSVVIGVVDGAYVQILDGLSANDRVTVQ
ncbi:MAG: efflux RND transporter periplasmic adaptor subunit [Myxococcota bacterium]